MGVELPYQGDQPDRWRARPTSNTGHHRASIGRSSAPVCWGVGILGGDPLVNAPAARPISVARQRSAELIVLPVLFPPVRLIPERTCSCRAHVEPTPRGCEPVSF